MKNQKKILELSNESYKKDKSNYVALVMSCYIYGDFEMMLKIIDDNKDDTNKQNKISIEKILKLDEEYKKIEKNAEPLLSVIYYFRLSSTINYFLNPILNYFGLISILREKYEPFDYDKPFDYDSLKYDESELIKIINDESDYLANNEN